jgi:hypothetical protein
MLKLGIHDLDILRLCPNFNHVVMFIILLCILIIF